MGVELQVEGLATSVMCLSGEPELVNLGGFYGLLSLTQRPGSLVS